MRPCDFDFLHELHSQTTWSAPTGGNQTVNILAFVCLGPGFDSAHIRSHSHFAAFECVRPRSSTIGYLHFNKEKRKWKILVRYGYAQLEVFALW